MTKVKCFTSVFLLFCSVHLFAQKNNREITQIVFNNITNSVGNNFPSPPKLNIISTETKVAYIDNGIVYFEQKAIDLLCSLPNKEDALAYVLSHELAHHYLNHAWMKNIGFTYTSQLKKDLKNSDLNSQKIEESQADLYGGFFSQISGYKSLATGPEVLKMIYKEYNLPDQITGYPSLIDRENIIKDNLIELNKLSVFFKLGNLLVSTEDYNGAVNCFQHILSKNFTSREIYNNLGAAYLKIAIDFDDELSKYSYPILFEENTRASIIETTRGFDDISETQKKDTINYYLNLADDCFKRSSNMDAKFIKPKINLLISELIRCKASSNELNIDYGKRIKELKLINEDENDIILLSYYLGLNKSIIEKEKLLFASLMSKNNSDIFHEQKQTMQLSNQISKNQYTKIINDLEFTGITQSTENISSGNGLKIKICNETDYTIYEFNNNKYFIEIPYKKIENITEFKELNSKKDLILKYGTPTSILKFNNSLYLNYKYNKFVAILSNEKLSELIYYN